MGRKSLSVGVLYNRYMSLKRIYDTIKEQLKGRVEFKEEIINYYNDKPIIKVTFKVLDKSLNEDIIERIRQLVYELNRDSKELNRKLVSEHLNEEINKPSYTITYEENPNLLTQLIKKVNLKKESPEQIKNTLREKYYSLLIWKNKKNNILNKEIVGDFVIINTVKFVMGALFTFLILGFGFPIMYNLLLFINILIIGVVNNIAAVFKEAGSNFDPGIDMYTPVYILNIVKNDIYSLVLFLIVVLFIYFLYNILTKDVGLVEKVKIFRK